MITTDNLIERIDKVLVKVEAEAKRPGSTYIIPSIAKSLRIMQERIKDNTLKKDRRLSFCSGLIRALEEDYYFLMSKTGREIGSISEDFVSCPGLDPSSSDE